MNVLLVDTSHDGTAGSMSRYARLVMQALTSVRPSLRLEQYSLGYTGALRRGLPSGIGTWVNHAAILIQAGRLKPSIRPDVVHLLDGSYAYLLPQIDGLAKVATVHDLIPHLQAAGRFGSRTISPLANGLLRIVANAWKSLDGIVADSSSTRADLMGVTGIALERVDVVHPALDRAVCRRGESDAKQTSESKMQGAGPLVLHVGNNAFYKNRAAVLRIFASVRKHEQARLVMAGAPPDNSLLALVDKLGLRQHVRFKVYPDDNALNAYYSRASLLVFPSLYEGFGWPPLEAMACGCPVVCSSEGSLPEVVGDAALTAPAAREDELAAYCLSVLRDHGLAARLSEAGRARANQFTLERMGRQLLEVYDQVLQAKRRDPVGTAAD